MYWRVVCWAGAKESCEGKELVSLVLPSLPSQPPSGSPAFRVVLTATGRQDEDPVLVLTGAYPFGALHLPAGLGLWGWLQTIVKEERLECRSPSASG